MCDVFGPPSFRTPYQRYHLYRKRKYIYVLGIDKIDQECSILRINTGTNDLELSDGEEIFPLREKDARLRAIAGPEGGLPEIATASGIVGFVRFLQGYYLILITRHRKLGQIGHHYVSCIEGTFMVQLFNDAVKSEEKKFQQEFNRLNLSKDFYFSYSYHLGRTVQVNMADAARARASGARYARHPLYVESDANKHHRFVWNHHHMEPFLRKESWQRWCLPIIHGFFHYAKCVFGWSFEVVLIARRSRFYAGTRYRKRGLNVDGQVANEVETEQLLIEDCTRQLSQGHVMSFVQIRGSVPLFWSQEATAINPKPPIVYPRCDPTLSATRLHFKDLLERYGTPQLVVNLMKARKVDSYEARLSKHFESAIERMNRELPSPVRMLYRPFDVKNHSRSSDVFVVFAKLAESVVSRVGFFHTGQPSYGEPRRVQSGVVRTNCVDCLDRTNVLQFFVGLEVFKQQLSALGLLREPRLDYDSSVVGFLSEMYDLMGDHLALQYAGSVAHKKYQLLGCRPRMMPTSKELKTSITRHYSNSFHDIEKQASVNLFLGIYKPLKHPRLWDFDSDSWVHHRPLRNDFNPGEWWEAPLRIFSESTAILRGPHFLPGLFVRTEEEERRWFEVVHRVWKFTWFEKLLPRLGFSLVEINSNRRSSVLPPHKTLSDRSGGRPSRSSVSAYVQKLLEVAPADLELYQSHADLRHLSRLIWTHSAADIARCAGDLSRAQLSRRRRAMGPRCPEPTETVAVTLAMQAQQLHLNLERADAFDLKLAKVWSNLERLVSKVQTSRSHTKSGRNVASRVSGGDLASMARQSPDAPASGATSSSVSEAATGRSHEAGAADSMERFVERSQTKPSSFGGVRSALQLPAAFLSPSGQQHQHTLFRSQASSEANSDSGTQRNVGAPGLPRTSSAPALSMNLKDSRETNSIMRRCSYCNTLFPVRSPSGPPASGSTDDRPLCPTHYARAEELAEFSRWGGLRKELPSTREPVVLRDPSRHRTLDSTNSRGNTSCTGAARGGGGGVGGGVGLSSGAGVKRDKDEERGKDKRREKEKDAGECSLKDVDMGFERQSSMESCVGQLRGQRGGMTEVFSSLRTPPSAPASFVPAASSSAPFIRGSSVRSEPWERSEQGASGPEPRRGGLALPPAGSTKREVAFSPVVDLDMNSTGSTPGASPSSAPALPRSSLATAPAAPRTPRAPPPAPPVRCSASAFVEAATEAAPPAPTVAVPPPAAGCGVEDALRKHLWSYGFPHVAPRMAETSEFGLPAWWLQTLRPATPATEDPTMPPLERWGSGFLRDAASPATDGDALDADGTAQDHHVADSAKRGGRARGRRSLHRRAGSSGSGSAAAGNTPSSSTAVVQASAVRDMGSPKVHVRVAQPQPAHTTEGPSIFQGGGMQKFLDEVLGPGECSPTSASPVSAVSSLGRRDRILPGHSRTRSTNA